MDQEEYYGKKVDYGSLFHLGYSILILVYYVMSFICSSFGVKGLVPPIIAAWFPVVISISGGFYFLRRTSI